MNGSMERERELRADLAELRSALHEVHPPPADEVLLRGAFRARQQRVAETAAAAVRRGGERRRYLAAAAAVAVVVATVIGLGRSGVEPPGVEAPPAAVAAAPATPVEAAFQPLLYAPRFSPSAAYSVVRVRIPLSSFAVVQGTALDGTIEADLLVGEDGLARGIRFSPADTLRVSAAAE